MSQYGILHEYGEWNIETIYFLQISSVQITFPNFQARKENMIFQTKWVFLVFEFFPALVYLKFI